MIGLASLSLWNDLNTLGHQLADFWIERQAVATIPSLIRLLAA